MVEHAPVSFFASLHNVRLDPTSLEEEVEHYSIPAWPSLEPDLVIGSTIKSTKVKLPDVEHLLVSCLNPSTHKIWRVPKKSDDGCVRLGSTEWAVVVPHRPEELDYLHAALDSSTFRHQLTSYVTGTTNSHQRVKKPDFLRLLLPRVNEEHMSRIGALHRSIRKRCEEIGRGKAVLRASLDAVFWEWFVRCKTTQSGLTPSSSSESTVETAYGHLPSSWPIVPLSEVVDVQRGFSYTSELLSGSEEGTPMVNLASVVPGGGFKSAGLKHIRGEIQEKFHFQKGDVFLATVDLTPDLRVVGSPLIAPSSLEDGALFSQDMVRLRPKPDVWLKRGFLFHWLKVHRGVLKMWSTGTTVSRFPMSVFAFHGIARPPQHLHDLFSSLYEVVHAAIEDMDRMKFTLLDGLRQTMEQMLHADG